MTPSAIATGRAAVDPVVDADEVTARPAGADPSNAGAASDDLILADMLIEEISIDGMCGVY